MLIKEKELFKYIIALLLIFNKAIVNFVGISYATYGILLFLMFLFLCKKVSSKEFLLYAMFVPNKYLQLGAVLFYAIFEALERRDRLKKAEIIFVIYVATIGALNCLFYDGYIWGTLFQAGLYCVVFRVIASFSDGFDKDSLMDIMDTMFWVQIITAVIDYLKFRALGDPITGTLISAHYFGIYLMIYCVLLIDNKPKKMSWWGVVFRIILTLVMIYASDAKHVFATFVFAFLAYFIARKLNIKHKVTVVVSLITLAIIIGACTYRLPAFQNFLSRIGSIKPYLYDENYNKKAVFFARTFGEMLGANGIFGFGAGQFGSQISITLSKGDIFLWNETLNNYRMSIEPYRRAMYELMTQWYSTKGIGISSMVLGYPMVSFVGVFAELGIVGYALLLLILDDRFKWRNATFLIAFFILSVFDTYLEIPCVFVMTLIATRISKEEPCYEPIKSIFIKGVKKNVG